MKEVRQGMEVIEKTRWEGNKTVGLKRVRRNMKRIQQKRTTRVSRERRPLKIPEGRDLRGFEQRL